jgi:hypothetical protein
MVNYQEWQQPPLISVGKKRGRPKTESPLIFHSVGLTADQWAWLALWMPNRSTTAQLRELINRAFKFWPAGPSRFR